MDGCIRKTLLTKISSPKGFEEDFTGEAEVLDGGSRKGLFDILGRLLSLLDAGGAGDTARRNGLLEAKLRPVGPGDGARWPVETAEQRQHRFERRPVVNMAGLKQG